MIGAGNVGGNLGSTLSKAGHPVVFGEGALVGAGAVVLQYRRVGEGATVGAGAVVTKDLEPGVVAIGVPARPVPATR